MSLQRLDQGRAWDIFRLYIDASADLLMFTNQKPPIVAASGQDSQASRPRAWDEGRLFLCEHLESSGPMDQGILSSFPSNRRLSLGGQR
jgi:hypothetical protein